MPKDTLSNTKPQDLEIKDAQLIFDSVWAELEEEYQHQQMLFPHEIIWLGGAPGAGKGTNTPFIMKTRSITAEPIVISGLLDTPEAKRLIDAGLMVGDRAVVHILLRKLLEDEYRDGVVVDGFPRTKVQVECLKLFYHRLLELHNEFLNTSSTVHFRKPLFRIVLLFVSEKVSVERQLSRGEGIREHNITVRETGVGQLLEERATDLDPALCRKRYRTFKESTFEALQSLRKVFHFYFVDAESPIDQVEENIEREFAYQSSIELSRETYELLRHIPLPQELSRHARQELVERLETYGTQQTQAFSHIIRLLETKFIPIIRAHSISGIARINTEDTIFDDPKNLRMAIDVLTERGYHVTVDIHKSELPDRFDLKTGKITCRTQRVFRFHVHFQAPEIRRGHH